LVAPAPGPDRHLRRRRSLEAGQPAGRGRRAGVRRSAGQPPGQLRPPGRDPGQRRPAARRRRAGGLHPGRRRFAQRAQGAPAGWQRRRQRPALGSGAGRTDPDPGAGVRRRRAAGHDRGGPDGRPGAVERRPARCRPHRAPDLAGRARNADALAPDRAARPLPARPAGARGGGAAAPLSGPGRRTWPGSRARRRGRRPRARPRPRRGRGRARIRPASSDLARLPRQPARESGGRSAAPAASARQCALRVAGQDPTGAAMRIGIVVDSTCDLPVDYLQANEVEILPISVRIGNELQVDYRGEAETPAFLHAHIAERGASAETIPFSVEQIRDLFLQRLVVDYDHVFCITVTSTRSPIFDHATQASYAILNEYRPIRSAAGHNTPFALRVVDTRNLFSAQGILPVEAVRLRTGGEGPGRIRGRLEHLALHTYGYL